MLTYLGSHFLFILVIYEEQINILEVIFIMSDINSSLIGFLKKKSLFSDSPGKSLRFRQRSKDKKNFVQAIKSPKNNPQGNIHNLSSQSSHNLHKQSLVKNHLQETQSDGGHKSLAQQRPTRFYNSYQTQVKQPVGRRNFNFKNTDETKSLRSPKQEQNINLWTGLVNYATTFESSRIESAQCLQGMSLKLQTQLSNINYKIDVFHSKMTQILNRQFGNMKQKIYQIVNKVFEESEHNIRMYIKQQEEILAGELIQMKETLTKEFQKVQIMKEDINKPNWRKVAGELLSTELEQKVDNMLYKSRSIDIGHWEIGDLGIGKVASLQNQLRDMIKLNNGGISHSDKR